MSLADIVPLRSVGPSGLDALSCPVVVVVFRKLLDERAEFRRQCDPFRGYGAWEYR